VGGSPVAREHRTAIEERNLAVGRLEEQKGKRGTPMGRGVEMVRNPARHFVPPSRKREKRAGS